MKILHIIPTVGLQSFGLGPVALNLAREQVALGQDSEIWSLDSEKDLLWAAGSSGLPAKRIRGFSPAGPAALRLSPGMEREAERFSWTGTSIVHQHGIWSGISRVTAILRQKHGVPSVISPHGMLEKWALKKSHWKKMLALALYESNNMRNAACIHACSEQEADGFREYGLKNPVAVIPNGIDKSWLESTGNSGTFRSRFALPSDKRIMLFLSRIAPVKGLPLLLDTLGAVRDRLEGWLLVIAGADEDGHEADMKKRINVLGLDRYVRFVGMLTGQLKRDAFAAAELFVLPTQRENFGIVVIEALGAGVPVLATKGAPWQDLIRHQCGWWVDADASVLARNIEGVLATSSDELMNMGRRGKELVTASYTWSRSAQMTIDLYEWLQGKRERPEFVLTG